MRAEGSQESFQERCAHCVHKLRRGQRAEGGPGGRSVTAEDSHVQKP